MRAKDEGRRGCQETRQGRQSTVAVLDPAWARVRKGDGKDTQRQAVGRSRAAGHNYRRAGHKQHKAQGIRQGTGHKQHKATVQITLE